MPHADALIPIRWNSMNETILPAFRALVLAEDPRPLQRLVGEALERIPPRGEHLARTERESASGIQRKQWFSLHALSPLWRSGGTDDLETFVAHLVSPEGKRDSWGGEYGARMTQVFRSFRAELSRRFAPATWPSSLEEGESAAADEQLDELFAELLLFFCAPRFPEEGNFSSEQEDGAQSALLLEVDRRLWRVPLALSRDGFLKARAFCPALFTGVRRFPFSRTARAEDDNETLGPLLPREVVALAEMLQAEEEADPILRRIVTEAAGRNLALFTWRRGL